MLLLLLRFFIFSFFPKHLDEVFPDEELNDQELKAETDGQCYCRFFKKVKKLLKKLIFVLKISIFFL